MEPLDIKSIYLKIKYNDVRKITMKNTLDQISEFLFTKEIQ